MNCQSSFEPNKKTVFKKKALAIVSVCVILIAGFCIFTRNYDIPLPFDANRMSVEEERVTAVVGENGRVSWRPINTMSLNTNSGDMVLDTVKISYRGINNIGSCFRCRTIERNGEAISVLYYCYTKTLWNSLFVDSDLLEYSEGGDIHGPGIFYAGGTADADIDYNDYKPAMREIYYLPVKNLHRIDKLSDEEYDQLKESSDLIWSGVI